MSQEAIELFGDAAVFSFPRIGSNHNPILLEAGEKLVWFGHPFHFEKMSLLDGYLEDLIGFWWSNWFLG